MSLFEIGLIIGMLTFGYIVYEVLKFDPMKS